MAGLTLRPVINEAVATLIRPAIRIAKVCELLDCDESQARRLLDDGEIEGHGFGARGLRIYVDSIASYQERMARATKTERRTKPLKARRSGVGLAAHRRAVAELERRGL